MEISGNRQQKAAERAELLESIPESEKELFRKRKSYVSIRHEWRNFFENMSGDDVKELILGIIDYDETGNPPELKNPVNIAVFTGFIKAFLDSVFDEWLYTCVIAKAKGKAGGEKRAANAGIVRRYKEKFGTDNYNGVPIRELLNPNAPGWQALKESGATSLEIATLRQQIKEAQQEN